jgi:PEGA domain-containing protein
MPMTTLKYFILIIFSVTLFGCATMADGPRQVLSVDSVPQGATVYVAKKDKQGNIVRKVKVGVTPLEAEVARKDGVVILELEGYVTEEAPLVRGTNGTVVLDFLALSLLSTSVDLSTGAWYEYDPGKYLVEMKPAE